jgi:hypothetical protein
MVADYLVYELNIPFAATKKGEYYFTKNELLEECLQKLPLHLRIISWVSNKIQ